MRKRLLIGVAGAALLIAGFVGGMFASGGVPAFAATNTVNSNTTASAKSNYCQLYINTLTGDLHISASQLKSANTDAIQKVLNQMRQDGKITAAQETRIEKQLQNASKHPCATLRAAVSRAHAKAGKVAPALGAARQQIETAVAGALKLPVATLQQDLAKGQTVAQIASAQTVSISTVNTAYINAVKSAVASAQSKGLITQQQSSMLLNRIQQAVNAGHYPGLETRAPKAPAVPATSTAQQ